MYEECVGKEMLLEAAAKLKGIVNVCGIYSITNKLDGKVYVGKSKYIYTRAVSHAKSDWTTNKHLKSAIAKYGIENFVHKVELLCKEEELSQNEIATFYNYKNNGTVMYNIAECGSGGNTMKFASEEHKAEINARHSVTLANRTAEEIAETTAKRNATLANKTAEEKAETNARHKTTLINRTAEEVAMFSVKRNATLASRTAEEKADIFAKVSTTLRYAYKIKYGATVEDTIKFCLQNKLFTFCKYKKLCIANNLEIKVSVAYFDRIMKFAKHKEQLQEFISIYIEGMDYNTYSSLCKLKPITKEVYSVTVKYSTYKYFI